MSDTKRSALEIFEGFAASGLDEQGIWPAPMIMMRADGTLDIASMAVDIHLALKFFAIKTLATVPKDLKTVSSVDDIKAESEYQSVILGVDRYTRENQGTEFASVLTCFLFERDNDSPIFNIRDQYRFGVINYQHEPRIIRPMDFNNKFWNTQMRGELESYIPNIQLKRKMATTSTLVH